jgi:large subunit ribosomal protein L17
MAASLIQHGAIRTTATKAKELRGFVERLITIARRNTLHARRQVIAALQDRYMTDDEGEFLDQTVVQKLFSEVAPKYASRPGGYTRIIHLSDRRIGDAGRQVLLQLVEETKPQAEKAAGVSRRRRRADRRRQAAEATAQAEQAQSAQPPSGAQPASEPAAQDQQEQAKQKKE